MASKIRHGLIISITVIALLFASVMTSYPETTTYIYDELNRLIRVVYEDGRIIEYTYDEAGNRLEKRIEQADTTPPTGTITINSGAASTNNPSVTLTLTCSDNVGCSQMQFSNDNVTYSTPEAYGTTKSWTLTPGDGTKTVYAKFKDAAGNWSTAYSDTIDLDSYTKSLLHMNGTDGSPTFTDSASGGTHTWTARGTAQIDTAQYKFGGASGLFDGNSDWIDTPTSADFSFGTGDFTIDGWIKFATTTPQQGIVGAFVDSNNVFQIWFFGNAGAGYNYRWLFYHKDNTTVRGQYICSGDQPNPGTASWHHWAWVRSGSNAYFFLDGTSIALTQTVAWGSLTNINSVYQVGAAKNVAGAQVYVNGWLDEVRISKGIARWTSNFTPPTSEYYP